MFLCFCFQYLESLFQAKQWDLFCDFGQESVCSFIGTFWLKPSSWGPWGEHVLGQKISIGNLVIWTWNFWNHPKFSGPRLWGNKPNLALEDTPLRVPAGMPACSLACQSPVASLCDADCDDGLLCSRIQSQLSAWAVVWTRKFTNGFPEF